MSAPAQDYVPMVGEDAAKYLRREGWTVGRLYAGERQVRGPGCVVPEMWSEVKIEWMANSHCRLSGNEPVIGMGSVITALQNEPSPTASDEEGHDEP